jgi:arylsulfatase/uncharacterized sulfatase
MPDTILSRIRTLWAGAAACALAILGPGTPRAEAAPAPASSTARPNIVLILFDDLALMDLGAYGGEARSPNIDRLARQGAMFTGYHTSPCARPPGPCS